jgi:hypothetical protein
MKTHGGAQGHEGAFLGHDTPKGTGAPPYIGNAPGDAPIAQGQGHVRILLSEAASRHLAATGERCFVIASRAMRGAEEPDTMGRWALYLVPCSLADANAAVRVARGISKESKPRNKR